MNLVCPECGSEEVTVSHVQTFMVNSGDHYCHSVKCHDPESEARCLECRWSGCRHMLTGVGDT